MDFNLTLDMILELPREMLKTSEKYGEFSQLIRKEIRKKYNFKEMKNNINQKFNRFRDLKYLCNYSYENATKTTANYNFDELKGPRTFNSQVENNVSIHVDDQIWMVQFYYTLLTISSKLTIDEATYFVYHYFSSRTDEDISELLERSVVTLQDIKKSCLIKVYQELKALE